MTVVAIRAVTIIIPYTRSVLWSQPWFSQLCGKGLIFFSYGSGNWGTVWVTSARTYNFSSWRNSHTRPQTSDPLALRPLAFPYRTLHLVNKWSEWKTKMTPFILLMHKTSFKNVEPSRRRIKLGAALLNSNVFSPYNHWANCKGVANRRDSSRAEFTKGRVRKLVDSVIEDTKFQR